MGLGGIARDSMVGLDKLVHDSDDDEPPRGHTRRYSGDAAASSSTWNSGLGGGVSPDEADDANATMPHQRQKSFELSLNDGITGSPKSPSGKAAAPSTTPRSSAAVAAATSYSKVSATNSRSLDSYRSQATSPANNAAVKGVDPSYQGFQYEGYTDYYAEGYNYDDYSYGSMASPRNGGGENKNIFCCLFAPWMTQKTIGNEEASVSTSIQEGEQEQANIEAAAAATQAVTASPKSVMATPTLSPTPALPAPTSAPSESPTNAAATPKVPIAPKTVDFVSPEKQPQPTTPHMMAGNSSSDALSTSPESVCFDEKKQEEGDIHPAEKSGGPAGGQEEGEAQVEEEVPPSPVRSILKVRRCSTMASDDSIIKKKLGETDPGKDNQRHFLPTYEPKATHAVGHDKSINFNPMARVLTIPSRKDIPLHQKAQVWWQRCDYDEFKKTGRIISKAMECGGSEIWLASSNAWGNRAARQSSGPKQVPASKEFQRSESQTEEEYNKALSKYVGEEKKEDEENTAESTKWWCKFGHSRRGLEHIASNQEGKARQRSVLTATRMVLEEQKRQRASRTKDPNKLRNVAMRYTSWARDLSLAAGSADAEAVASGFDPDAACRAQHFAKRLNVSSTRCLHAHSDSVGGGVAMAVTSHILDANTHARNRESQDRSKMLKDAMAEHARQDSMSTRAKGYIPGGGNEVGFRSVKV